MKKLLIFLFALSLSSSAISQVPLTPWTTPTDQFSQMWSRTVNVKGAYFDVGLAAGLQKDTSCSGCRQDPLYLTSFGYVLQGTPRKDTIRPVPLYGSGNIQINFQAYKTGRSADTPKVVVSLYQSDDAYTWDAVSGLAAQTLRPFTSLPKSGYFSLAKNALYYQARFDVTVDSAMCQSSYHYLKSNYITISGK